MIVNDHDVVTEGQQSIVCRESDLGGVAPISSVAGLGDRLVSRLAATADAFEQLAVAPSRQAAAPIIQGGCRRYNKLALGT